MLTFKRKTVNLDKLKNNFFLILIDIENKLILKFLSSKKLVQNATHLILTHSQRKVDYLYIHLEELLLKRDKNCIQALKDSKISRYELYHTVSCSRVGLS